MIETNFFNDCIILTDNLPLLTDASVDQTIVKEVLTNASVDQTSVKEELTDKPIKYNYEKISHCMEHIEQFKPGPMNESEPLDNVKTLVLTIDEYALVLKRFKDVVKVFDILSDTNELNGRYNFLPYHFVLNKIMHSIGRIDIAVKLKPIKSIASRDIKLNGIWQKFTPMLDWPGQTMVNKCNL